jgi:hypothetical protein
MIKGKAGCLLLGGSVFWGAWEVYSSAVLALYGGELIRLEIRRGQSLARIRGKEKPGLTESGFLEEMSVWC